MTSQPVSSILSDNFGPMITSALDAQLDKAVGILVGVTDASVRTYQSFGVVSLYIPQ